MAMVEFSKMFFLPWCDVTGDGHVIDVQLFVSKVS